MQYYLNKLSQSKSLKILSLLSAIISLNACAPVIIGGGALVGGLAVREKGVGGAITDSQISTILKAKIYGYSSDLYTKIGINVQNAEVLLTGSVPNPEWQGEAERIAWQVKGVKQVINHIEISHIETSEGGSIMSIANDSLITSRIKSELLLAKNIQSLNYSIKTVGGVVYIMGDAQSQDELDKVSSYASKTKGVKRVVSYVRVRGDRNSQ